jgi:hypothetical protein
MGLAGTLTISQTGNIISRRKLSGADVETAVGDDPLIDVAQTALLQR